MDPNYSPEDEQFRHRVREFLSAELPEGWQGIGALDGIERENFRIAWRAALRRAGFLAPSWPQKYGGGGLGVVAHSIVAEEFVRAGVPTRPGHNDLFSLELLGPTLIHWGTEEQREYFLPRTIDGEIRWAQGYSEPDSGSDLFNLRTRASLDGDEWVIDGQKVWQSAGLTANWLFVLVRTDPAAERSKGLSFLLVPVDQPGVEVRGIRNLAGKVDFTEVFFNGARTSKTNVLGEPGNGARVALTLLGFERGAGGVSIAEAFRIQADRLVQLARSREIFEDSRFRERIVECFERVQIIQAMALQNLSAVQAGRVPGAESSVFKLLVAVHHQKSTELAIDLFGLDILDIRGGEADDLLEPQPLGSDPQDAALWLSDFLHARAGTIYGGSQEIQRSTIGERVLGLPREPRIPMSTPR